MRHKSFQPFSNILALRLSIILSIFLDAALLLGYFYSNQTDQRIGLRMTYAFLSNVALFYSLYGFNFRIIQSNIRKRLRLKIHIWGSLAITAVLSLIFAESAIHLFQDSGLPPNFLIVGNIIKDIIVLLIVLLSTLLLHSISQRQQILLENERLVADNIRIRYEVLKNQVDPHFLFNSLNTLDGLIGMDNDRAHEYVQNLSQVFRYAIGNKEIMRLEEELDFTESYAHLMKIRYGENIQIHYNIAEKYKSWYIMPISLQLLVENAIKHNVISNKHPLVITIESTPDDTIRVLNAIQLKKEAEEGEGIGLANLTERYKLLFQKDVSIAITDIFCVEIPLIKDLEDTKFKNNQYAKSSVQAGRIQCYY
ncbi:MAG: histidine kinase [Paludibacter sp.]